MRLPAIGLLVVCVGLAQPPKNEKLFEASCSAVWQASLPAFSEHGFDPEDLDRPSGFAKFAWRHGSITQGAKRYRQSWTTAKAKFLDFISPFVVESATLTTIDEPVGCKATIRISYNGYRCCLVKQWEVLPSNGNLERKILEEIEAAQPSKIDLRMSSVKRNSVGQGEEEKAEEPKLRLTSEPTGADVFLNGKFVGSTPSTKKVATGLQEVELRKKGYAIWSRTVSLQPGESVTLHGELEAESAIQNTPKPEAGQQEKEPGPRIRIDGLP